MNDTAARCPVSTERIDENSARINGGIVVLTLVVALFTPWRWLLGLLAIDFAVKVVFGFAYSPNCKISHAVAEGLHVPRKMMDSAPKRFAATVGLVMSIAALACAFLAPGWAFLAVACTFLVFATLEAFAGFCMGCFLYGLLPRQIAEAFVRSVRQPA